MGFAVRRNFAGLQRCLSEIEGSGDRRNARRFGFGMPMIDDQIGGGLAVGALHEVFSTNEGDGAAASGFALAMCLRACQVGQPILWVRQDMAAREYGELSPVGFHAFGARPEDVVLVRVRDAIGALRAAADGLRCAELGAVLVEPYGAPDVIDLTASRRLNFAAAHSGICAFMVRLGRQDERPSAAISRWRVAAIASRRLGADAPGLPAFRIALTRHRDGCPPRQWRVEWDRDNHVFRPSPLSRSMAPIPHNRPAQAPAPGGPWRRAG